MNETPDVLIVGGGPAGSSCAWKLRQAGLDVLVLDKSSFPRNKVCAGWITPQIVEELRIDTADYARERVLQPVLGFRTSLIGGKVVESKYDRPISYGIRRCEFDHYLLERSGARLRTGEPLRSVVRSGDAWLVNDSIRTPLVIGAGGHFCPVARFLGAKPSARPVVLAQEIEIPLSESQRGQCDLNPEIIELFFSDDLKGYGWCFRKGDYLNVGFGREDHEPLGPHVEAFWHFLAGTGKVPPDVPEQWLGHAYALYKHVVRKRVDDGMLLIGDAAGLAYAPSGEGIRPAIESGLLAADLLLSCRGDYRKEQLHSYETLLVKRFGKGGWVAPLVNRLPVSWKRFLARRLFAWNWFSRRVLIDRWFLHLAEPPLN